MNLRRPLLSSTLLLSMAALACDGTLGSGRTIDLMKGSKGRAPFA